MQDSTRLILLLAILAAGCDSADTHAPRDLVVVEAFLYAGLPVSDIRLTNANPLNRDDSVAAPVNDAAVRLIKGGRIYDLVQTDTQGRYHYPGNDLAVEAGDEFRLEIAAGGHEVSAVTTVPPKPVGVALSDSELVVPRLGGGPRGPQEEGVLTVTWDNSAGRMHFVVIESTGTGDPDYIFPDFVRNRLAGFRLVTRPTDENFYDIRVLNLEVLGPHRAHVHRVNQEYADLYNNRNQDSRDLNEPPSNIQGGLGIFSAFNSESADFDVVRSDE